MSDKPIQTGDLVMIVRPAPCGCATLLGTPFTVSGWTDGAFFSCVHCRYTWDNGLNRPCGVLGYRDYGIDPRRLIRIDPPAQIESTRTEETLKEPA